MADVAAIALEVGAAARRIEPRVVRTPCLPAARLSALCGAEVRWKLENVQRTGSFKLRGATNALLCMDPATRARGVVAASSGNHGLGLAAAGAALGARVAVFVPEATPDAKVAAIRSFGAEVARHGDDCVVTEAFARAEAERTARAYVSPYNDRDVMAGQGSVAVELLEQWPEAEVLVVALGGGGLIAGMAAYAKALRPDMEVIACSPAASPAMAECVRRGRIVDVVCGETLSDSTAGGVESDAITFPLCCALVDRFVEVEERAIARAIVDTLDHDHLLVEGAAAVAIAAAAADPALRGRRAAVVVCGGNLPAPLLVRARALAGG
ncbi:MAG: pyridoxal-phosphate dependent enzyme [Planctomycetes bacterium]|nr:pyridoxal-phosphate dependent enzyme [Planctomycetota bacterium]